MFKNRTLVLSGAALILVAALATTVYLKLSSPATPASTSNAEVVLEDVAWEPAASNPVAARSVYVSEQRLRWIVDEGENLRWDARAEAAWHTLSKRHEYRCCGLPR